MGASQTIDYRWSDDGESGRTIVIENMSEHVKKALGHNTICDKFLDSLEFGQFLYHNSRYKIPTPIIYIITHGGSSGGWLLSPGVKNEDQPINWDRYTWMDISKAKIHLFYMGSCQAGSEGGKTLKVIQKATKSCVVAGWLYNRDVDYDTKGMTYYFSLHNVYKELNIYSAIEEFNQVLSYIYLNDDLPEEPSYCPGEMLWFHTLPQDGEGARHEFGNLLKAECINKNDKRNKNLNWLRKK